MFCKVCQKEIDVEIPTACHYECYEKLREAASNVFNWYFIFGEDNEAAREHLANLGNLLKTEAR